MRTATIVIAGLLALTPTAARAGAELTLAGGLRVGDVRYETEARTAFIVCVTTPCVLAEARTEDDATLPTLLLDVPLSERWMVEALFTRQEGDVRFASAVTSTLLDRGTFDSETFLVGLMRQRAEGRLRPFATAALGATRFESDVQAYRRPFFPGIQTEPVDQRVLAASLSGGVKVGLARHLGARFEGRSYWHDLPGWLGGTWHQTEASAGLTYRW